MNTLFKCLFSFHRQDKVSAAIKKYFVKHFVDHKERFIKETVSVSGVNT